MIIRRHAAERDYRPRPPYVPRSTIAAMTKPVCIGVLLWLLLPGLTHGQSRLGTIRYASGFSAPVAIVQHPTDPAVQFVVEQGGRIRTVQAGQILPADFLDHGAGNYTIYGSLKTAAVKPGQSVAKGEVIGETGISDPDLPAHLHFEVRTGGRDAVDPMKWLRSRR